MNRIGPSLALFAFLLSAPARADVVPMDVGACQGKVAGDPCQVFAGEEGACRNDTCSRNRYRKGEDGKMIIDSEPYACLRCERVEAKPTEPSKSSATTPAAAATPSGAGKSQGCASLGGVRAVAPWVIAGSFSLLFLVRRRRAR